MIPVQTSCDGSVQTVLIPGPKGDRGEPGPPGRDGVDGRVSFSTTKAVAIVPPVNNTVTVTVDGTEWVANGMTVQVGGYGWYQVSSKTVNTITLINLGYPENSSQGTSIATGTVIVASGRRGADGVTGAPTTAEYLVKTANAQLPNAIALSALTTGWMKVVNGTGVVTGNPTIPASDVSVSGAPTNTVLKPSAGVIGYGKVTDAELDHAVVTLSGTDVNWLDGRVFFKALTANTTFTFSNPIAGKTIMVVLKQDTTPRTVAWPASVKWPGGTNPGITSVAGAYAIYSFLYVDGVFLGALADDRR